MAAPPRAGSAIAYCPRVPVSLLRDTSSDLSSGAAASAAGSGPDSALTVRFRLSSDVREPALAAASR